MTLRLMPALDGFLHEVRARGYIPYRIRLGRKERCLLIDEIMVCGTLAHISVSRRRASMLSLTYFGIPVDAIETRSAIEILVNPKDEVYANHHES